MLSVLAVAVLVAPIVVALFIIVDKHERSFFTVAILDHTDNSNLSLSVVLKANDNNQRRAEPVFESDNSSVNEIRWKRYQKSQEYLLLVRPWEEGSINYNDLKQIDKPSLKLVSDYGTKKRDFSKI